MTVEKRGPRRFYRPATPLVAGMLEAMMAGAATGPQRFRPPSAIDVGALTAAGSRFLGGLGIGFHPPTRTRRPFCRLCLDWSERRPHLAGQVGASIAYLAFARDWIRRRPRGRSVEITETGATAFKELFGARI